MDYGNCKVLLAEMMRGVETADEVRKNNARSKAVRLGCDIPETKR